MAELHVLDEHFFSLVNVSCEMGTLRSIRRAIPRWEIAVGEEMATDRPPEGATDLEAYWHDLHQQDQAYTLEVTKNALFAGLAVSATSAVERLMKKLCEDRGLPLPKRANWGHASQALARYTGTDLSSLAGFTEADRVRLLNNCFKHNGGCYDRALVDALGSGSVDEEIRYCDLDWDQLLGGVETYLTALGAVVLGVPRNNA